MDDAHVEDGEHHNKDEEVAPALISVHQNQNSVAVAVGLNLRIFGLIGDCGVTLVDESNEPFHKGSTLYLLVMKNLSKFGLPSLGTAPLRSWIEGLPKFQPERFLVSGSGDSMIRLWDIISGSLLDTRHLSFYAAVTDPCTIPDCTLIAAAIQNFQGIMLLSWDLSCRTLSIVKVVSITGETFIPTSLGRSITGGLLWMCAFSVDEKVFLAAAEALRRPMCNLLIKKQYPEVNREFRNRTRNDRKIKR
ncbi:hypothetical protein SLA2020_461390 [Shorea laevis]